VHPAGRCVPLLSLPLLLRGRKIEGGERGGRKKEEKRRKRVLVVVLLTPFMPSPYSGGEGGDRWEKKWEKGGEKKKGG